MSPQQRDGILRVAPLALAVATLLIGWGAWKATVGKDVARLCDEGRRRQEIIDRLPDTYVPRREIETRLSSIETNVRDLKAGQDEILRALRRNQ